MLACLSLWYNVTFFLCAEGVNSEEESVGERSSLQADKFHLGLFTDRRGAYLCLQQEGKQGKVCLLVKPHSRDNTLT